VVRQVGDRARLDGDELFIDLLMFHIPTVRYVVIELKTTKLTAGEVGQLNVYVAAVDDLLRQPGHNDTIGLLLCTRQDRPQRAVTRRTGGESNPQAADRRYRLRRCLTR
jgi:hypothetical protein